MFCGLCYVDELVLKIKLNLIPRISLKTAECSVLQNGVSRPVEKPVKKQSVLQKVQVIHKHAYTIDQTES